MANTNLSDRVSRSLPTMLTWEKFLHRLRTVFFGPWVIGILSAVLLAAVAQSREAYLAIYLERLWVQGAIGFVLILLLCAQIDCWHRMLGIQYLDATYPEHRSLQVDQELSWWNGSIGRAAAVLPLAALITGVTVSWMEGDRDRERLAKNDFNLDTITDYPVGAVIVILIPVLWYAVALIFRAVQSWCSEPLLVAARWRMGVSWTAGLIGLAALIVPVLPLTDDYAVATARIIGPLGITTIALITLVAILMGMSWLSMRTGLPLVAMTAISFAAYLVFQMAGLDGKSKQATKQLTPEALANLHNKSRVIGEFQNWLRARPDRKAGDKKPYPVFIVTAQGGGIYAAATTTAFLTSLQDECSAFTQHIFAISGVSGGAVGSAVFGGLMAGAPGSVQRDCYAPAKSRGPLAARAAEIMGADHLSPAVMQIWPDFTRLLPFTNRLDRSAALEHSFACSFEATLKPDTPAGKSSACRYEEATAPGTPGLRIPYMSHWSPKSIAPAQILNATWSETGYRVAFAPFSLHAVSDGTLFAYPIDDKIVDFSVFGIKTSGALEERRRSTAMVSLIEAAFVSARFPGIVPAYQLDAFSGPEKRTWNLVDGGYVDNSGATTALELYKALDAHVRSDKFPVDELGKVDLYLVMLTDATTDPNLTTVAGGTTLNDTVAPVNALLSVRSQLSNRAVRRAIDEVAPVGPSSAEITGRNGRVSPVLVVNVKQAAFEFPLGWKISPRTLQIIDRMLGHPDFCKRDIDPMLAPGDVDRVINDNSCVKRRLRDILAGTVVLPEKAKSAAE